MPDEPTKSAPSAVDETADLSLLARMFRGNQAVLYASGQVTLAKIAEKEAKTNTQAAKDALKAAQERRARIDDELSDYMRVRVPDPTIIAEREEMARQKEQIKQRTAEVDARAAEVEAAKDNPLPIPDWAKPQSQTAPNPEPQADEEVDGS